MSQETKIKTRIRLLSMEKGFLAMTRRNGGAEAALVASEIELERLAEIERLQKQLQELGLPA